MIRKRYLRKQEVVDQKLEHNIYNLGKVDDRIQILQLATWRSKRQNGAEVERWFYTKLSSRLGWKIVEIF